MAGRSEFGLKGQALSVMLSELQIFSHGGSLSFKRTTPTVVFNDTGSPREATSTVDPPKPNLTQRFVRRG